MHSLASPPRVPPGAPGSRWTPPGVPPTARIAPPPAPPPPAPRRRPAPQAFVLAATRRAIPEEAARGGRGLLAGLGSRADGPTAPPGPHPARAPGGGRARRAHLTRGPGSRGSSADGGGRRSLGCLKKEELSLGNGCSCPFQFDKWTDAQRRRVLAGLLERCSVSQQQFCCRKLQARLPAEALDFTTKLPRVLSLYIFSFLDPRSLCRCAQVSWHWKNLTELDQLWMVKCLRFSWCIDFSPTPFEQGVWKKHYIQMVRQLHVTKPKTPPKDGFVVADVRPVTSSSLEEKQWLSPPRRSFSSLRKKNHTGEKDLPPWRCSDRHPMDIIRFNYLDNCGPGDQARPGRRKRHEMTPDKSQDKKNKLQDKCQLRKAQSLVSVDHKRFPTRSS
ncbi:F-box only protein 16 [Galemys pyrenaicus]|uniref:F-box only protein 16 n=1 Tax=Galemys pyrenaicus TaxID=202257 RepID=A0A8J6DHL1_GALPY|nr:F-box only protein 16 [Galemys pyrenaicus]